MNGYRVTAMYTDRVGRQVKADGLVVDHVVVGQGVYAIFIDPMGFVHRCHLRDVQAHSLPKEKTGFQAAS